MGSVVLPPKGLDYYQQYILSMLNSRSSSSSSSSGFDCYDYQLLLTSSPLRERPPPGERPGSAAAPRHHDRGLAQGGPHRLRGRCPRRPPISMYTNTYIYIYIYIHTYTYMIMHLFICIYYDTYIYIHTHIYRPPDLQARLPGHVGPGVYYTILYYTILYYTILYYVLCTMYYILYTII